MRQLNLTLKTKINIFLAILAMFFGLGLFYFIKPYVFKESPNMPRQVKTQENVTTAVTPQSKPEATVQTFLTNVHDTLLTQAIAAQEVQKAVLLLSEQAKSKVIGKSTEETFQNILKLLDISDPSYTSIEVTDSYFKNGKTIVQTKLKYDTFTLKRNFNLYIENELWKIDEVQLVTKIQTNPDDIKGWKTYGTSLYSIMTPQDWFTYGTNPAEIQNFDASITDLTKLTDGSIKINITYQKAESVQTTDDLINCDAIANSECTIVEINGNEFKKIVSSSQYETNNAVLLIGQKNGYTFLISGVVLDKSDKNLFNSVLESISTLRIY